MTFPDPPFAFDRILIMGNGGAGKTWLARRVSEQLHHPVIHLDDMHWEPGRYGIARDRALRDEMVKEAAERDAWVMEGVYGQLANMVLNRTTILIWIDLPEEECIVNIKKRGIQGGETGTQFDGLLKWVAEYRSRTNNWNSFEAHARLFSVFSRPKFLLSSREAVTDFADRLSTSIDEAIDERAQISNDEGEDAGMVVQVFADEHWNAYHDIRRAALFEARGLTGYDANHPDDRREGHFPLLLLLENTPIGAARLDLTGEETACVRTVAIRAECQGNGYGRMLMAGLEKFASRHGVKRLLVNAARDAVGFYDALGWTVVEAGGENPVLTKELRTGS